MVGNWHRASLRPGAESLPRQLVCFYHDPRRNRTCKRGNECCHAHLDTRQPEMAQRYEQALQRFRDVRCDPSSSNLRGRSEHVEDRNRQHDGASRARSASRPRLPVRRWSTQETETMRREVDNAVEAKVAELQRRTSIITNDGSVGSANPALRVAVLSCWSLGKSYVKDVERKENHTITWEGLRSACAYYRQRGVRPLGILSRRVQRDGNEVPADLAEDVFLPPGRSTHGVLASDIYCVDLCLFRFAMLLKCQIVNNAAMADVECVTSQPDIRKWLTTEEASQGMVQFVFDANGGFVPLKPPPPA